MGLKYLHSDFIKLLKKLDIELDDEYQNFNTHCDLLNLVYLVSKKFLEKSN